MLDRNLVIAIFNEALQESRGDPFVLRDLFIEWVTAMDESVMEETYCPQKRALPTGWGNRLSPADRLRIVEFYKQTGNMSLVARRAGTTSQTVAKILDDAGIPRRRNRPRRPGRPRNVEGMAPVWEEWPYEEDDYFGDR